LGAGYPIKGQEKKVSGRFLKKAPQKLLLPGDGATARVKLTKVFCGAFLQKSDLLLKVLPP
jgi:hypothetical protein